MRKAAPLYSFLGALLVLGIGILIPTPDRPLARDPADPSDQSRRPSVSNPAGRASFSSGRLLAARAARSGRLAPEDRPELTRRASGYEELLALVQAAKAQRRPDFEQLFSAFQEKLGELNGSQRSEALVKVAELVTERELDRGLEFLQSLDEFRDRHNFVRAMVEAVPRENLSEASEWAARLPEMALVQTAYNAIGMKWGQTDLEVSLAWAQGLSDASLRLHALEGITWAWGQKDPMGAYNWAAQLPEPEIRDKVFVKLAKMISIQDARRGAEWALQFPEGPGRTEALDYAVFQWAGKEVRSAAEWVAQIPEPGLRENGLAAVARSWSNSDPPSASAWAAQLPPGQARISALITTVRKWAEVDAVAAARWLERSEDPVVRGEVFTSVTSGLAKGPAGLAEVWLSNVGEVNLRAAGERIIALQDEQLRSRAGLGTQP